MPTTEIATIDDSKYLALNHSAGEIQEIMRDNLAGQEVTEFDLPRIVMPAGGGINWEIPTLGGATHDEELSGIVVYTRQTRAYWRNPDPTGELPDCSSRDGVVGVGDPGGECKTCPFAQFGSEDGDGRGQACKQMALWFLLREDSFLPFVLSLPPTSLNAAKKYMLALAGGGVRASEVVTAITLEKDTNPGGQSYSRAVPKLGGRLEADAATRAREYAEALRPTFDATAAVIVDEPTTNNGKDAKADSE